MLTYVKVFGEWLQQSNHNKSTNPHAVEPLDLPADFDKIIEELREFYTE